MRIAMISEHASPLATLGGVDSGGQNVYVAQTARHLGLMGHQVDVFSRRDAVKLPIVQPWTENVRVVHVPAGPARFVRKEDMLPLMEAFWAFMLDFCRRRERYDVVHANFFMSGLVARELKKALGIPYVVTFHALGRVRLMHQAAADGFPKNRVLLEQSVIDMADAVVAECPQDEEDLTTLYRTPRSKLVKVPCGYDPDEMSPVAKTFARRVTGLPEQGRVILQLGRIVPRKGIENVIRGLGRLVHGRGVEAKLAVVGGETDAPDPRATPEMIRLHGVARAERVADRVLFLGRKPRERLKYYYSAADVFITTPWYEPFGMTPLEAMACARPVIGSDVGGIKHTVVDGKTGYLVPPEDPEALADRLAQLYRQPWRLKWLGWRAQRRAWLFTWERVAQDLERVYEEVCEHAARPGRVLR